MRDNDRVLDGHEVLYLACEVAVLTWRVSTSAHAFAQRVVACADVNEMLRLALTTPPGGTQCRIYPRRLGLDLLGCVGALLLKAAEDRYRSHLVLEAADQYNGNSFCGQNGKVCAVLTVVWTCSDLRAVQVAQ